MGSTGLPWPTLCSVPKRIQLLLRIEVVVGTLVIHYIRWVKAAVLLHISSTVWLAVSKNKNLNVQILKNNIVKYLKVVFSTFRLMQLCVMET